MCLYLKDKQPRVAKEDIIVMKYITLDNNGEVITPFTRTKISINKINVAHPKKEFIQFYEKDFLGNCIYTLTEGAIYAALCETHNYIRYKCKKAIIPAGTEYWVDIYGRSIAARSMIITDIDWDEKNDKVSENIFEEVLESAPEINNVRVGDYLLENGDYIRPQKGLSEDEVVGIVAGFHKEKPIITSLKFFTGIFDKKNNSTFGDSYHISREAKKAFDGQIITQKYKEGKREDRFEAFEACLNYRKNKNEEWYLGAVGEVATMLSNWGYLNTAHRITGLGFIIKSGDCYTTCSENGWCCSWYCQLLHPTSPDCFWYDKGTSKLEDCIVVPFLDYENYKNKIIKYNNTL